MGRVGGHQPPADGSGGGIGALQVIGNDRYSEHAQFSGLSSAARVSIESTIVKI